MDARAAAPLLPALPAPVKGFKTLIIETSESKETHCEVRHAQTKLEEVTVRSDEGQDDRAVKKALIPGYGKKDMGWLHPQRKLYNEAYKRTTFSIFDLFK